MVKNQNDPRTMSLRSKNLKICRLSGNKFAIFEPRPATGRFRTSNMVPFAPVSYTHLDVYKRQTKHWELEFYQIGGSRSFSHTFNVLEQECLIKWSRLCTTLKCVDGVREVEDKLLCTSAVESIWCSASRAVSYTHLDVYKRQQEACVVKRTREKMWLSPW